MMYMYVYDTHKHLSTPASYSCTTRRDSGQRNAHRNIYIYMIYIYMIYMYICMMYTSILAYLHHTAV